METMRPFWNKNTNLFNPVTSKIIKFISYEKYKIGLIYEVDEDFDEFVVGLYKVVACNKTKEYTDAYEVYVERF